MVEEIITLYLGLKEGQRADFEVVGLSAAAFAEAVKEIAFILEPGLEVASNSTAALMEVSNSRPL
jgi:hypothetical protein